MTKLKRVQFFFCSIVYQDFFEFLFVLVVRETLKILIFEN